MLDLKKAIESLKAVDGNIKLIQQGKVLGPDEATLEGAGVKDSASHPGSFIVVMVSKKAAAAASAPQSSGVPPPPVPTAAGAATGAAPSASAPTTASAPTATASTPSNPFAGPEFEANLANLKAMGLAGEDAAYTNALIASFNNPDRAVEFLFGGIPAGALERALGHGGAGRGAASGSGSGAPRASGGPAGAASHAPRSAAEPLIPAGAHASTLKDGPLYALRVHPQLNDLKAAIQSSPAHIPHAIAAIADAAPELAAAIEANKDGFLALMNEPITAAGAGGGEEEEEEEDGEDGAGGQIREWGALPFPHTVH